jgi:hypothetical protein
MAAGLAACSKKPAPAKPTPPATETKTDAAPTEGTEGTPAPAGGTMPAGDPCSGTKK